jgi:hypothetical protein
MPSRANFRNLIECCQCQAPARGRPKHLRENVTTMPTVHVALLGEGTQVWRSVPARRMCDSTYELLGIVPSQEEWQFTPGQVVECEKLFLSGGETLVGVRLAQTK